MELQIPSIQRMVCHICGEFLHAACSIKRHFINTERRVVFKMKMVFNAEETPKISWHRWSLNFFQCLISLMMLFHAKVGVLDSSRRLEGAAKNIVTEGFIGANQQTCANIWEGTSEASSSKDAIDYRALLKWLFSTFDLFFACYLHMLWADGLTPAESARSSRLQFKCGQQDWSDHNLSTPRRTSEWVVWEACWTWQGSHFSPKIWRTTGKSWNIQDSVWKPNCQIDATCLKHQFTSYKTI